MQPYALSRHLPSRGGGMPVSRSTAYVEAYTPIGEVLVDASLSVSYTSPRQLNPAAILVIG
ncbi:hypothetical protein BM1_03374 [Bipolaris maydis]|nr:hypothetical protein BM1_03374 [Bipolaris maydis]